MQNRLFSSGLSLGIALVGLGILPGCSKARQPWEKVYPVSGVVQLDGKPIGGALLTLVPQDRQVPDSVRPTATSNWDGTFEVGTYSTGDGAPAGAYKVIVLRFPVVGTPQSPAPGANDLPLKYARPESTDLSVQVKEAATELSLELKS